MASFFDVVTVTCFVALVIAFFQFTDRNMRTLAHMLFVGVVLAVANQVGNSGATILAFVLVLAGAAYAVLIVQRQP